jgi:hypothetical protein
METDDPLEHDRSFVPWGIGSQSGKWGEIFKVEDKAGWIYQGWKGGLAVF